LIDPDPPTWRAWLGHKNSDTGTGFNAQKRNAPAYLKLLEAADDAITATTIEALATESRDKSRGAGRIAIWDRAKPFLDLRQRLDWNSDDAPGFLNNLFYPRHWIGNKYDKEKAEGAALDLQLLQEKALALLKQEQERDAEGQPLQHLRRVA